MLIMIMENDLLKSQLHRWGPRFGSGSMQCLHFLFKMIFCILSQSTLFTPIIFTKQPLQDLSDNSTHTAP